MARLPDNPLEQYILSLYAKGATLDEINRAVGHECVVQTFRLKHRAQSYRSPQMPLGSILGIDVASTKFGSVGITVSSPS